MVRSSTGRAFAGLVLVVAIGGCGGSQASPSPSLSPSLSPTASPSPTLAPSAAPSPTPTPTFVATGSMNEGRVYATATLLRDGKVLIAGGSPELSLPPMGSPVLASAELYDPTTGKMTRTGSMLTARSDATATLLPDGRVLIAGGYGCRTRSCSPGNTTRGGGSLASAELYDPTTDKFTRTGSMSAARTDAVSMLLPDGRVLILNGGSRLAELYDPATGRFTRDGSLQHDYFDTSGGAYAGGGSVSEAALLPNAKVLVVGPSDGGPASELFDPASGKSTSISLVLPDGAVEAAKAGGYEGVSDTATLLKDGRVLLCVFDYLVTYDPVTGSFKQSGSISTPGQWSAPTTTLLPDGRVLFAGGDVESPDGGFQAADSAGLYDPASGYQAMASMPEARAGHTATLLPNGTVLIAGGTSDEESGLSSAELFGP
jgi:hypothetical protein